VTTPGKRSLPPPPKEGGIEHMLEPTKTKLRHLRDQLAAYVDKPLPPELYQKLHGLILWADWRIDRLPSREQIRYQRWRVVHEGIREFVARYGTRRGSQTYGYAYAAKELVRPYAGSASAMKQDFLAEEHAPADDPLSVRRRKALERGAREADRKRSRQRRGR
jgi:hypothetical protein